MHKYLLVFMLGCGQPEPASVASVPATNSPADHSGSRLKLRVITSSDGMRHTLDEYFDSELMVRCGPIDLSPTKSICLPLSDSSWLRQHYFTDPVCTKGVASAPVSTNPEDALIIVLVSPAEEHIFRGESIHTGRELYHDMGQGCVLYEGSPPPRLITVGDDVTSIFQEIVVGYEQ